VRVTQQGAPQNVERAQMPFLVDRDRMKET
jgi:hypothetical protein